MTAGTTHHQLKCRKAVPKSSSSDVFDESTHSATTTRAKPMTTRTVGHALRRARCPRRRGVGVAGVGVAGVGVAPLDGVRTPAWQASEQRVAAWSPVVAFAGTRAHRAPGLVGTFRRRASVGQASVSLFQDSCSVSGMTRVSATAVMKLVSPDQRGRTWRWTWEGRPAPAARPRLAPMLRPSGS